MTNLAAAESSQYGRHVTIAIADTRCHVCKQAKRCIAIDTSDEEYGSGCICRECALQAFADAPAELPLLAQDEPEPPRDPSFDYKPITSASLSASLRAMDDAFKHVYERESPLMASLFAKKGPT